MSIAHYSSCLFIRLSEAPAPILLSDGPAVFTQPAGRGLIPYSRYYRVCVRACVLINQSEGIQLCHRPPAGPIICESSGVISGNQEVGSEALKEEEERRGGWGGGEEWRAEPGGRDGWDR